MRNRIESSLSPSLLARWANYPWPGDVRELRNAVARALALGEEPHSVVPATPPAPDSPETRGGELVGAVVAEVLASDLPLDRARQRVVNLFAIWRSSSRVTGVS